MSKPIKIAAAGAGAIAVVGPTAAVAEEELIPSFELAIEGGLTLSDFSEMADGKLGFETDFGGYGSIAVGRQFDGGSPYDWRVTGTIGRFLDNEESYEDIGPYGDFFSESHGFRYEALDFDIGRRFHEGNVEARMFAGVRGMHLYRDMSIGAGKIGPDGSFYGDFGLDVEFFGVGPRVGGDVRVGQDWGLVAGLSGSALYGRRTIGVDFEYEYDDFNYDEYDGSFEGSISDSEFDWIGDLTAQIGVSFRPGQSSEVIAGYRAKQIWNVAGEEDADGFNNILTHGPFVQFKMKF